MEGVEAASESGDGTRQREHDQLELLRLVAEEGDARLVLARARERESELRTHDEATNEIDNRKHGEGEIVVDAPLAKFVAMGGHRRDRGDAILPAEIIPASCQSVGHVGASKGAQGDKDRGRRVAPEQGNTPTPSDKTRPMASAAGRTIKLEVTPRSRARRATLYPAAPKNNACPKLMMPA